MPTPPLFLRKNVILKTLDRETVQECDSKGVRFVLKLQRIDPKGFASSGRATRRAFIGDLAMDSGWHPNRSTHHSMKVIEFQLVTE
jgi:hypothetical protein